MKKHAVVALILLLAIPIAAMLGGFLFSLINPELAAGNPNYARNWHLLNVLKVASFFAGGAVAGLLWLLVCFLVIHSKERSLWWLLFAALGPFGFAVLAMLDDKAPAPTDRYARLVQNLNWFLRAGYEALAFVAIWTLSYEAMVVCRNLLIQLQSAVSGTSVAQIIAVQNASSGMWAFGESIEVMYLVILFYLLRPAVFNLASRVTGLAPAPKAH